MRALWVESSATLVLASAIGYEVRTALLASGAGPAGGIATAFLVIFAVLCALSLALAAHCVLRVMRPALVTWDVLLLLRARRRFRRHPRGTVATVILAVWLVGCAVSLAAATAVTVQLRAGQPPGIVGRMIGVSAPCVVVADAPGGIDGKPMLWLGQHAEQDVFLVDGRTIVQVRADPIQVTSVADRLCAVR